MLRVLVLALALLAMRPLAASACRFDQSSPFVGYLGALQRECNHTLCGQVFVADPARLKALAQTSCAGEHLAALGMDLAGVATDHVVLFGETHDNATHHKLRASWLEQTHRMIGNDAPPVPQPALVFEHIRADQQPALDQFRAFNANSRRLGHSSDLFRFLEWEKSAWPDQKMFEPLFAAAIQFKLPILPGDPSRDQVRAVAKGEPTALSGEERNRLKLDQPLDPKLQDALLTELEASHCGLVPKSAFGNMAMAQRYRDAHLADALMKAADAHRSAVLFAGNGHVRSDRGVPYYLRQMAPNRKVVTVMLLEVEDGKTDPQTYVARNPDGKPAVDYILFTPRAERKDPCVEMREMFGRKK